MGDNRSMRLLLTAVHDYPDVAEIRPAEADVARSGTGLFRFTCDLRKARVPEESCHTVTELYLTHRLARQAPETRLVRAASTQARQSRLTLL